MPRRSDLTPQSYTRARETQVAGNNAGATPDDGKVDSDYIGSAVIGIAGAAALTSDAAATAASGISAAAARVGTAQGVDVPATEPLPTPIPKPDGITDDRIETPSGKNDGKTYTNPNNPNDNVRVMPAIPNSINPSQQVPYGIDQDGGFVT